MEDLESFRPCGMIFRPALVHVSFVTLFTFLFSVALYHRSFVLEMYMTEVPILWMYMTKIYISEYRVVLILFALFHRFDLVSSHYIYILLKCLPRDFFSTSRGLGLGRIRGSIFRDFGTSRLWKVRKYWPYPWTCDGGALALCPRWRCRPGTASGSGGGSLVGGSGGGSLVGGFICAAGCAHSPCW